MVVSSATTPADFTALAVFFVSFAIPFDVSLIVLTSLGLLILFLTALAVPTPVPAAALPAATFSPTESAFFPSRQPGGCGLSWPEITVIKTDNIIVFQVVICPVQLNPVNENLP
ncbi:hypothetical protein F7F72_25110, partial [Escherichia coli]